MDWGNESPVVYTVLFIVVTGLIQLVLLALLALFQGGSGDAGPVNPGGIDPLNVVLFVVLFVTPVYVLFYLVNLLVSKRLEQYHNRAHGLPAPDSIEESDLLSIDTIDEDTAEELFESGYESTDHLELVDALTIARESAVGQRTAEEIKAALDERDSE